MTMYGNRKDHYVVVPLWRSFRRLARGVMLRKHESPCNEFGVPAGGGPGAVLANRRARRLEH